MKVQRGAIIKLTGTYVTTNINYVANMQNYNMLINNEMASYSKILPK